MARRPRTVAPSPKSRLGRKPPPPNETRHDRFIRIGTKRMKNVIRQIQLLGNLCSPNYECEPDDLALIRDTVLGELEMALARFSPKKRAAIASFSFQHKSPALADQ